MGKNQRFSAQEKLQIVISILRNPKKKKGIAGKIRDFRFHLLQMAQPADSGRVE